MKAFEKIETLIETRINGNSIKGNSTYENMIKSLKSTDFMAYDNMFYSDNPTMNIYKKVDKIEKYIRLIGVC